MKISLLDPGLRSTSGHHFDLDRRLVRALSGRGHEVVVHGGTNPAPTLAAALQAAAMLVQPTFRVSPYRALPATKVPVDAYRVFERATQEDLRAIEPSDLWLWPTLAPYQLAAAVAVNASPPQIAGTWWLAQHPHQVGADSWARSARQLSQAPRPIIVGAFDELLCDACQSACPGLHVAKMPCPHDGAPNTRQSTSLKRIGFFGHQRNARGMDLMSKLVASLLARGFEILVQDSGGSVRNTHAHPRLEVLPYIDDFACEIARCDLVIWPSRRESYTQSCSGVVSESIATAVPLIMPSGCLPASVAARLGCGTFFHEYSCEAILQAVDEAVRDFPALAARARRAATAWHADNGTDRLAQWIETHAKDLA